MKKTSFYYRGAKKSIFIAVIFLVLVQVLALAFPLLLKSVADMIYEPGTVASDIVLGGVLVFGVVVIIFVFNFLFEFFVARGLTAYQYRMRTDMFEKLKSAPTEKINELGSDAIMPMFMNDTVWLRGMQRHWIIIAVFFPISILGSIVMLFTLGYMFAIMAFVTTPLIIAFFIINSRRIGTTMKSSIPAFDDMHREVKEGIDGAKEIRMLGKAKVREREFSRMAFWLRKQDKQTRRAHNLSLSFNALLFTFTTAAIVIYGALTMTDVAGIIVINTAIQYMKMLFDGVHHIFTLVVDFVPRVKIAKKRIDNLYALPSEMRTDGKFAKPDDSTLKFENVSYKYPNRQFGLEKISFTVTPGSLTVLAGGTGSGRSVLPGLILQTQKTISGKITIGETDISEINPTFYRKNVIAYCGQEPELIPGKIRDNLKILNPMISDDDIMKFFRDINAMDFVKRFGDNFLDFEIYENCGFSLATRKLLCIARTLLKDAPIYVFNQSMSRIQKVYIDKIIDKLKKEKRTCLFISQSNLVTKKCDKVYVLKHGRIVADGNHTTLMKESKEYKELFSSATDHALNEGGAI